MITDYFSIFLVSFVIALSGALSPGPFLAAVISESAKHGFKSAPLMILGHALLEIIMVAFIILGFARFVENALILKIIGLAGALILMTLGGNMLRSLPNLSLDFKESKKRSSGLVFMGITMSLANPYWTIWWLTIGLGLVLSAGKAGFTAIAVFFSGHILADLGWYSIVSFMISRGRQFLSLKIYKKIILACALSLIGFGVYFGFYSIWVM